jgi:hypothetical protein
MVHTAATNQDFVRISILPFRRVLFLSARNY